MNNFKKRLSLLYQLKRHAIIKEDNQLLRRVNAVVRHTELLISKKIPSCMNTKTTELNPAFWDCKCETNYIHLKDKNNNCCDRCHAHMDDQPDSHQREILNWLLGKNVVVRHDYFEPADESLIITLNKIDTSHEEYDQDILWDTLRHQWVTPKYAFENIIP